MLRELSTELGASSCNLANIFWDNPAQCWLSGRSGADPFPWFYSGARLEANGDPRDNGLGAHLTNERKKQTEKTTLALGPVNKIGPQARLSRLTGLWTESEMVDAVCIFHGCTMLYCLLLGCTRVAPKLIICLALETNYSQSLLSFWMCPKG